MLGIRSGIGETTQLNRSGGDDDEDLSHLLVTDLRRLQWCFGLSLADN